MVKPNTAYKEARSREWRRTGREWKPALNLPQLAHTLRTSPMKRQKPRKAEKQIIQVRRSARNVGQPTPVYREVEVKEPRSYGRVSKHRDLSNRVYARGSGSIVTMPELRQQRKLRNWFGFGNP